MDTIFKALNDPARRHLLDCLRAEDGQSLGALEAHLPALSRFGVMKHLKVLEEAGLVVTRRQGRFKLHYLNALPLQEVIDRWIEPLLAKPAARAVIDFKAKLERSEAMAEKPDFMMSTYIRCSQDALWDALQDPAAVPHYHFISARAEMAGGTMTHYFPDGRKMLVCRTVEADPKRRVVTTFEPQWEGAGGTSRVVYLIEPQGAHCRLTVEHYDLTFPAETGVADGWTRTLSGLKTWLETGQDARFADAPSVEA